MLFSKRKVVTTESILSANIIGLQTLWLLLVAQQTPWNQASLLSGKMFRPSSTRAPSNMVHRGMHTNDSLTSASFSSLAHSVRQKASFRSMAVRYQARRRKSGEPSRGSRPGLQRPAILMASMRIRMPSNTQTGRKIRNQLHCTCRVERLKRLKVDNH